MAEQICAYFNESVSKGKLLNWLKLANITPGLKKIARTSMMIEFFKDVTDKNKVFGALLTELSNAFDYLNCKTACLSPC